MPKLTYIQKLQKKEAAELRKRKREQKAFDKKVQRRIEREQKAKTYNPLKKRAKASSGRKNKRIVRKIWHKLI